MESQKNNKIVILLVFFVILSFVLGGFICYDKLFKESEKCKTDSIDKVAEIHEENKNTIDVNALTKEIQSVYDKAYEELGEGYGIREEEPVTILVGEENTVGGVNSVKAERMNFSKIEPYFTKRGIDFIKIYFTDTPYGHKDGYYYIYATENNISSVRADFITTIFGETDQSKRDLKIKSYTDDMVVAISEKTSFLDLDEYIIFKKVDNTWKIDMFEQF